VRIGWIAVSTSPLSSHVPARPTIQGTAVAPASMEIDS